MDAAGELAQLPDRDLDLCRGLVRRRDRLGVRAAFPAEPGPQQAQRQRQRDEALLGAVVEVALQPAPLGVGRLEDPRPGASKLGVGRPLES